MSVQIMSGMMTPRPRIGVQLHVLEHTYYSSNSHSHVLLRDATFARCCLFLLFKRRVCFRDIDAHAAAAFLDLHVVDVRCFDPPHFAAEAVRGQGGGIADQLRARGKADISHALEYEGAQEERAHHTCSGGGSKERFVADSPIHPHSNTGMTHTYTHTHPYTHAHMGVGCVVQGEDHGTHQRSSTRDALLGALSRRSAARDESFLRVS